MRGRISQPPSENIPPMSEERVVIVAAHNEADRIVATLEALGRAFPDAPLYVADDHSTDGTASLVEGRAQIVPAGGGTARGKGGAMTAAARLAIQNRPGGAIFVLCDGDLGESAVSLTALARAVEGGECDLAVASFARRQGGGFGVAVSFARRAIRKLTGLDLDAPISGQRALRRELLEQVLPFAPGFGMETAMTIDAVRAGGMVKEIELDLAHRATGRTAAGFIHRGRQLLDFIRVYVSRR
jgi:glycosyltransferase involved in cell wall biosynthesis